MSEQWVRRDTARGPGPWHALEGPESSQPFTWCAQRARGIAWERWRGAGRPADGQVCRACERALRRAARA